MFLIKAGATIQVNAINKSEHCYNSAGWIPYTTTQDNLYENEEVFDKVAVLNSETSGRDIPSWMVQSIISHDKIIVSRLGRYAMLNPKDIQYID